MFNTLRKVIHSFTLRFHSKLWSMEHRTWLCVCVFWAKIPNLCNQTIHQSWRVAFMPKKKCLTFVMKTFERISLNHKNECEIGDALIEICMFEQMAKSERHLFLWNNVLFWEFIVFGRIYTWNIYLFSCDCSHFINFMLKTMFSLWSILFGRFTIYFSYTFLVLRIQKWTRRTRNVKFN